MARVHFENKKDSAGDRQGLFDVIAALQSLQRVQRREVAVRKNLLTSRANLYLALGGDWLRTIEPPSMDDDADSDVSTHTTRKPRA